MNKNNPENPRGKIARTIFTMLLISAMALSLSACGAKGDASNQTASENSAGASQTAGITDAMQEVNDEKMYRTDEQLRLLRTIDRGDCLQRRDRRQFDLVTDYKYDEFGKLESENTYLRYPDCYSLAWYEEISNQNKLEFEYDGSGNVIKVEEDKNGAEFKNGRIVREYRLDYNGNVIRESLYTYGSSGLVVREEKTIVSGTVPGSDEVIKLLYVFEYDNEGRVTYYSCDKTGKSDSCTEYKYEYDDNGNEVFCSHTYPGGSKTLEMEYDDYGREISCIETDSNGEVTYDTFAYDDSGNLVTVVSKGLKGTLEIQIEYDENGRPVSTGEKLNGTPAGHGLFSYDLNESNGGKTLDCWFSGTSFSLSDGMGFTIENEYEVSYGGYKNEARRVDVLAVEDYSIMPKTVEDITNEYGNVPVKVEIESVNGGEDASRDLYPDFALSYGGLSVPEGDGTQRLSLVTIEDNLCYTLDIQIFPVYDGAGVMKGYTAECDSDKIYGYSSDVDEYDEQGRLTRHYIPWMGDCYNDYEYSPDGRIITVIPFNNGNEISHEEINLDELNIKGKYLSFDPLYADVIEHDEYGLVTSYTRKYYNMDGTEEESVTEFEYSFEGENGILSAIQRISPPDSLHPTEICRFDEHGYLTHFQVPYNMRMYSIHYTYDSV